MDITDPSAPTQPTAASSDASSSNPQPENEAADPPLPGQENEVQTYQDLHVLKEVVLGPDDVPKNLSDDESSVPDDDSDASSIASSAVAMEDADAALLPPPDEDHSVQQLTAHTAPVYAVSVNAAKPDLLATGGGDDVAILWRVGQPQPLCKLEGHTDTISFLGFSADGTLLASAGLDGTVRVWSAENGSLVATLEGPSQGVTWLCWHTRGAVLLAGSEDVRASTLHLHTYTHTQPSSHASCPCARARRRRPGCGSCQRVLLCKSSPRTPPPSPTAPSSTTAAPSSPPQRMAP